MLLGVPQLRFYVHMLNALLKGSCSSIILSNCLPFHPHSICLFVCMVFPVLHHKCFASQFIGYILYHTLEECPPPMHDWCRNVTGLSIYNYCTKLLKQAQYITKSDASLLSSLSVHTWSIVSQTPDTVNNFFKDCISKFNWTRTYSSISIST